MPGHTDLTGQYNPFAEDGTSGYAHLGDQKGMFADHHIVGHMDQVVCFDPGLDPGLPEGCPVDGVVGPDFTVIINLDDPRLGNFDMTVPVLGKTEAVTADHRPAVNDDPLPDEGPDRMETLG